ncbi:MAG: DUF5722 domain-containing protein [bacterium]|nr:DUF5722 domain-containing protein [bacterium]
MKKKWGLSLLVALVAVMMLHLPVSAAAATVSIQLCYIEGDQVKVAATGSAAGDDGQYYLFALQPYETGVGARQDYCAVGVPVTGGVVFTTPLNLDTAASKLYSRFVVTVKSGASFVQVSNEMYILNPEAVATQATVSISEATGNKKGITAYWPYAHTLSDLGVGYAGTTVDTANFFNGGGINYVYNGKAYAFNAQAVQELDLIVALYNAQNADICMMVVNSLSAGTADMVHPGAVGTGKNPHYYSVNVTTQAGEEKFAAFMSFLANRYSGGKLGSVQSYVIGNEVNSSDSWHYAGEVPVEVFAADYARQFRVAYNAIKSHNSAANVYICTDQRWLHNDGGSSYGGKPVIDNFNAEILRTGNIDWGLSFHPYSVPLTDSSFWTTSRAYSGLATNSVNTRMITPLNMNVVTDYFQQPQYLTRTGAVRNIIISELGFSSAGAGNDANIQAAAIAYSYKLIAANPYIKMVLYSAMLDIPEEVAQGLANGLMNSDGTPKPAYTVYKMVDRDSLNQYAPFVGVSSWSQLGLQ